MFFKRPLLLVLALLASLLPSIALATSMGLAVEVGQHVSGMSADLLQDKIAGPLFTNPSTYTSGTLASGSWTSVFGTALPAPTVGNGMLQQTIQLMTITNRDPSATVCVTTTLRADADCSDDTAPSTPTCTGTGANDASMVLPSSQRTIPWSGDRCLWLRATAAAIAQAELVVK